MKKIVFTMRPLRSLRLIIFVLLLAACDEIVPTPVPTRVISGPTIQPTEIIRPFLPTPEPFNPGVNNPTAAALQRDAELPPLVLSGGGSGTEGIQITAQDGTALMGDLYPSLTGERVAGILLVAPDRTAWGDFGLRLQARGYTVLSMEMRDPPILGDFIAMLNALANAGTVDPGRIAVVAAEAGADLALVGCAGDLLCDALAMISPTDTTGIGFLENFLPRPLMVAAAQDDGEFEVAVALRDSAPSQIIFQELGGSGRGAGLVVSNPVFSDEVIRFLAGAFVS